MKVMTYSLTEGNEILIYEEQYDANENLIHAIDHKADPKSEKKIYL